MNETIFLIFLVFPSFTHAEDNMWGKIAEACREDDRIKLCVELDKNIENAEDRINRILEHHGANETVIITGTVIKTVVDRKVKIKTGKVDIVDANRSVIEASENEVLFKLEWDL